MKKRWNCPECGSGKLLSSAPRKNATGRYCLPCSERTGYLVERVSAALEKKRAAAAERSKAKAAKKRDKAKAAYVVGDIDVMAELKRVWKVACKVEPNLQHRRLPKLTIHRRKNTWYTSGRAWSYGRIHLSCGTDPVDLMYVLVHEVAHHVMYARDWSASSHGDKFKAAEVELLHDCGVKKTPSRS